MIFGLVALLVVFGIGMWIWSITATTAVEQGKPARDMANQLAGRGVNGMKASDSIRLVPMMRGNKVGSVLVDDIVAGGPMEAYYGLKRNDAIVQAGSFSFKGEDDGTLCKDMVLDAFQKMQPLIVMRDGEKITLPLPKNAGNTGSTSQPPAPAKPPDDNKSALQRQLDAIPGAR